MTMDSDRPPATDAGSPAAEAPAAVVTAPERRTWTAPAMVLYGAVVILAWAALELWGLGAAPFHTKGEPREALVVWEMTHHGGWILPERNGNELPSKPPLFHWLGALTALLHGETDEWAIRLPSAGTSLLALMAVFAAGCALWNPRTGLLSALMLMTTFEWARAATNARVDMTLTLGLQIAFLGLLFFLRTRAARWLVPMYLGITLAVLGKGPVGIVLPGLVALAMVVLAWDLTPLRRMRLFTGAVAVGIGAGTWYVLALIVGGYGFFRKQILGENLFTFVDNPEFGYRGHRHPWYYMLGALLLGVLPWTVALPGIVARLWRQRRELRRDDVRVYLLVWSAIVFVFYAAAASKRSVYLLGLYPALALLLGWWWDQVSRAPPGEGDWMARVFGFLGWLLMVTVGLLLVVAGLEALGVPLAAMVAARVPADAQAYCTMVSDLVRDDHWRLLGLLLAAAGALYITVREARARQWLGIFAGLWSATAILLVLVSVIVLPAVAERLTFRDFMTEVRRAVGPGKGLSFYRTFEYGAVYYWQGHIAEFQGDFPAAAPEYLLVSKIDWPDIQKTAAGEYEVVPLPADRDPFAELVLIRRRGAE